MGRARARGELFLLSALFLAQVSEPEARKGEILAIREEHGSEAKEQREGLPWEEEARGSEGARAASLWAISKSHHRESEGSGSSRGTEKEGSSEGGGFLEGGSEGDRLPIG
jgi:hypothetical protein